MSNDNTQGKLDVAAVRARLAARKGRQFWQGLEELAETDEFREFVEREFPREASVWHKGLNRRDFLKIMGASLLLGGLASCVNVPQQKIVPYVKAPDINLIPGKSQYYATAMTMGGYGLGLLAESYLGRPIKIEGNLAHPASLGATNVYAQAAILGLYDPDRSQTLTRNGDIRTYNDFAQEFRAALSAARSKQGAGLRILTEPLSSPTMASQLQNALKALPQARWHQWDPAANDAALAGSQMAFGRAVQTVYHFPAANTILSLDADFLSTHPETMRYARDFADRRNGRAKDHFNRLYMAESTPTLTGAKADHKLRMQAGQVQAFAQAVAARVGVQVPQPAALPAGVTTQWLDALARDLQANRGHSLIIAGDGQPAVVHALAHAMNAALGNVGQTVTYTDPVLAGPTDNQASLRELVGDMAAGRVDTLLILSANPVYTAPADLDFTGAYAKVGLRIHVGLYQDETARLSQWHIPETHFLEAWGDVRAFDGTVSIIQPLIQPLYDSHSGPEILALFSDQPVPNGYDIVHTYWQGQHKGSDFDTWWQGVLNNGVVPDTALAPINVNVNMSQITAGLNQAASHPSGAGNGALEIIFRPDPAVWDGRFANNAWLQELPKPLTKLTWDNAVLVSPATAERLNLQTNDMVELSYQGRTVEGPVFIMPGHADDAATVYLGYGRKLAGHVANGQGFNAYTLRTSARPGFDQGLQLRKTGATYQLATTQFHWKMEGRDLVQSGTVDEYQKNPNFVKQPSEDITLYQTQWKYTGNSWGMSIDMTACIGCNACVIACQAENNIPVVGKEGVLREREMHWLRIDRYYEGSLDDPETHFQPVPCMQCENAPCEVVCPVGATVHSADALNDMVYNRCVGTRYCSNNCPYKVRRFNFLEYTNINDTPVLKLAQNPEVTVRNRGVMEKCTYCVQRIRSAQAEAEKEGRPVRDGDVMTACQAACPANAITFGDMNDPNAEVNRWKGLPLNYALLGELNTRPHTTYLASLRNPNPEIEALTPRPAAE
jgi:MoCo/4Fe-4S cofactor protein with predicted Tat translocation signal